MKVKLLQNKVIAKLLWLARKVRRNEYLWNRHSRHRHSSAIGRISSQGFIKVGWDPLPNMDTPIGDSNRRGKVQNNLKAIAVQESSPGYFKPAKIPPLSYEHMQKPSTTGGIDSTPQQQHYLTEQGLCAGIQTFLCL